MGLPISEISPGGACSHSGRILVCGGMRVSYPTVVWGSDDPTKVLDFCPDMLYSRASGVSREEMRSPGFAELCLERLRDQQPREVSSDIPNFLPA